MKGVFPKQIRWSRRASESQLGELYSVQLSGCTLHLIQVSSSADLVLYSPLAVPFS
jgi:hypothetical protein